MAVRRYKAPECSQPGSDFTWFTFREGTGDGNGAGGVRGDRVGGGQRAVCNCDWIWPNKTWPPV